MTALNPLQYYRDNLQHRLFPYLGTAPPQMGEYIAEQRGIGEGLSNENIREKLDFIEHLHAIGVSKYVDLPQLVVVGDQSCGKSSVLQAITRLPFPVDDRMCTRFPTEVSLQKAAGAPSISAVVKKANGTLVQLTISQPTVFSTDSPEFGTIFRDMLLHAQHEILGDAGLEYLSEDTLQITVRGEEEPNLTIVDIPGLVSATHSAFQTANSLVNKYIKNPRSIVLMVAHPGDPGTQDVFQKLKNIPDRQNRVIGVITKCDRKQEGAEDWILDTIRNEQKPENQFWLANGWFGLRNRLPSEVRVNNHERDRNEAHFFQQGVWPTLAQPSRLGIRYLTAALTKMLNDHITRSIPALIPDINQKLAECELRLARLGTPRGTNREQRDCMVEIATKFSQLSLDALDGSYHRVPDHQSAKMRMNVQECLEKFKSDMHQEYCERIPNIEDDLLTSLNQTSWRTSLLGSDDDPGEDLENYSPLKEIFAIMRKNRGTELTDETNSNVMKILFRKKSEKWSQMASILLKTVVVKIKICMKILVEECTFEAELQGTINRWLSSCLDTAENLAQEELDLLSSEICFVWTLSHKNYLHEVGNAYTYCINAMARDLRHLSNDGNSSVSRWEKEVKAWLANNKDVDAVLNTFARLDAYYRISQARFIDNIGIQVVERHLLGPSSPLKMFRPMQINKMADEEPEKLKSIAGEREDKEIERKEINDEKRSLEEALETAQTFGYLGRAAVGH
ncbi:related to Mx2 protein (GTPase protein) [Phialocephala subalpina]|uniref:Related to Mx2 protein (GTPase protein) n=1 Tax=Phialocephala subalpina TaxID=576137 RepID=A0A1L7X612_9HELO|nr:related to Mx2 protein (GTPase protein) [Phialocephala subalpina]